MEKKIGNYCLGFRVQGPEIGNENVNYNNLHGESHRKEYGNDLEACVCVGNTRGYTGESCWGLRVI